MEGVVHDGWLIKSPPEKRIVKAKWRQRWFVLRHSGLLPGQFILEYFTDDSCRKLKGKIDLDQCEQVVAGLPFAGKKSSYQYMFDIRTPKRTYYLVAETEEDMNKWVDCICSVCGLKIHMEEDFHMPQDNSGVFAGRFSSNLIEMKSSSNPYIPISECHTGKPVINGNQPLEDGLIDLPKEPAPPPPSKSKWSSLEHVMCSEFYDYPKPLNMNSVDHLSLEVEGDNTYKVPVHMQLDLGSYINSSNSLPPPRINWNSYPSDSVHQNNTLPTKMLNDEIQSAEYDIVPSFHGLSKENEMSSKSVQSLANHFESMCFKKKSNLLNNMSTECTPKALSENTIPPRPPKPSKLREKRRYENFELPQQTSKADTPSIYDIPSSFKVETIEQQNETEVISFVKSDGSGDDISPSTKVPLLSSEDKETLLMDDTYDFPKFRSQDNINATVPLIQSTGTTQRQRRHAYSNAPPGLFNSKDLIFNYEYRPSLMTSDNYSSGDAIKSDQGNVSTSEGLTPPSPTVIGTYANVPTSPISLNTFQDDLPPAVNRELKPKKTINGEDRGSFSFLTLQPPPVCRSRTNKRSFRKPRAAPSPTPQSNGIPPVPNRFRHQLDVSTSDDEVSNSSGSRRNSSNDDQAKNVFVSSVKKDEIQYLDLDLDSEPSPSPKSPERITASTVYKQVDFVKTKAFNEMRQNVEESYRKSQ